MMTHDQDNSIEPDWSSFLGRSETAEQYLDPASLSRFLLALGEAPVAEAETVPFMAHWAYFLPAAANGDLGPDGHPRRGGFMPPVPLPRRMFAGGSTTLVEPLALGRPARCTTTILDIKQRTGRSGRLVFVDLERRFEQGGALCVIERQTIAYREQSAAVPPVEPRPGALSGAAKIWTPNEVALFRFSAVTFNAHRIHYDAAYARDEELYPGLVVHGPYTASMLCRLAAERSVRPLRSFSFSAVAPLFVNQPVALLASESGAGLDLTAVRQDGEVAMKATATY